MLHVFIYLFIYLTTCLVFGVCNRKCGQMGIKGEIWTGEDVIRTVAGEGCAAIGS